jgi:hypothetical protein
VCLDIEHPTIGGDMDETYRMLGREHEADLEREAHKRHRAAAVKQNRESGPQRRRRTVAVVAYIGSLIRRSRRARSGLSVSFGRWPSQR